MRAPWVEANQRVGPKDVTYDGLLYKLTLGSGSFAQWILIPHWGYLGKTNIAMSSHISSEQVVHTVKPC